ncbi:MAG TPA: pilus assembly protein TadG-related protein [Terriglobia bacterium]|nr:pilus assembly protein TadG-related protein [Terriglobia bacterium]
MQSCRGKRNWYHDETGSTLVIAVGGMVVLLGVSALALDMGQLYVVRSDAQRAADAAALAGAEVFVTQGCTSGSGGCSAGGAQETPARQAAENAGLQNDANGNAVVIEDSDVTFSYPTSEDPEITVNVQLTKARSTAPATLFAKVFGLASSDVTATATAEAYNPSGGGTQVGIGCTRPFLVPNCDPSHTTGGLNTACASTAGYFIDPSTGAVENPGVYPSGVIGESWALHSQAGPSQWYLLAFAANSSGSVLATAISQCSPSYIGCSSTLNTVDGKKVGPTTDQGIETLINASGLGLNQGQDSISTATGPPFPITGGANNPNPNLVGQTFYSPSASIVVVPVYDGHSLSPGGSTVTVIGYLQLFIQDVVHNGNDNEIDTIIMNVSGCPTGSGGSGGGGGGSGGGSGSGGTVTGNGNSPIPVRLIHQ